MTKRLTIFVICTFLVTDCFAQYPQFSIATDVGVQRNFKKEQHYWSFGHTVQALWHFTPKEGVYVWFCYYSNGNFKNNLVADAKSPLTTPQQVAYVSRSRMRLKQFSLGYKRYLKGSSDMEKGWSIYGYGGFGLVLGRIQNTHSVYMDTALYHVPVYAGKANFKRLTVDLGLGWEKPLGGDFYLYGESRIWIPTTDYPSHYIFVNDNAPLVLMLQGGLRLLF